MQNLTLGQMAELRARGQLPGVVPRRKRQHDPNDDQDAKKPVTKKKKKKKNGEPAILSTKIPVSRKRTGRVAGYLLCRVCAFFFLKKNFPAFSPKWSTRRLPSTNLAIRVLTA